MQLASKAAAITERESLLDTLRGGTMPTHGDIRRGEASAEALDRFLKRRTPPKGFETTHSVMKKVVEANMLLPSTCAGKCKNGGECMFGGCRCTANWGGPICTVSLPDLL